MVVVSGNWVKSVAVYPTSTNNSDVELSQVTMIPKAVLSCRPNSHLFQERTLALDQSVKIGRSVARAKPTSTNAIFDCKVLSRHHALLWYENGKFFLQDTKSSNGTFVNNNRLSAETENHELSSGDIVQFGVDVVENNRKVTHGCIIATIKLYMPDGKEAKASPVTEGDRHGMVPLDDLYKLNQIIQEANQREKCLETKLTALQHVVNETRKSAEESWQAYVGEERLLSRVSALETQLQQANKSWGEDRLREELAKLQESNESYQIAAKEALEKLHAERLQAMALAMEQERAKISAEQEAVLAKEQFYQAQVEVEAMARQLTEHQIEAENIQFELKQREKELESKLESESGKLLDLQLKLFEMNTLSDQDFPNREGLEGMHKDLIYDDDLRCKEELIAENDDCVSLMNMSNGVDNHISLTFGPVEDKIESEKGAGETTEVEECDCEVNQQKLCQEDIKRVSFKIAEDCESEEDFHDSNDRSDSTKEDVEKNYYASDRVDSKTLKYQFQSAQNELKRKIELLETISNENKLKINDLDKELLEEKKISQLRLEENEGIKEELVLLQQKWKESCNETLEYKDKMCVLLEELELAKKQLKDLNENVKEKKEETQWGPTISNSVVSYDQLVELEEELVLLKERFSQVSEEKIKLQRDFSMLTKQYNVVCNRSHNKYFFYVAPLVIMVLYLLSTLLSTLTKTESEAASYEFTTLTCIPGVIEYNGANIQLLDLPGIIEGAAQGKGRGRQVIAVARTADLVLMMLDATKKDVHRDLLERELESVGIRLNKKKPNIYFKIKKGGGLSFNSTCPLTKIDEKLVQLILHEYKIFNAEVLFREDCTADELIDVICANRVYLPCLYVYNKIDQISIEEVDRIARQPNSVVVSCNMKLNLDYLLTTLWEYLSLIRVYTKKPGQPPDFSDGLILRKGVTVEHVCHAIHRTLAAQFKYALVWGTSTKYSPQRVGVSHTMQDEDVIQVIKK